ncbi:MAG: DUF4382 domain-containing protein [Reichenbachiella sp.]|uniref:DUF4382 domain-containing protein n=1 Tax=Reichenbachiella sp. TaxID=2184521 RepID=UPI003263778F
MSCQEAIEEIDMPAEGTAIFPQSELTQLVTFTTLKDGSFDNILDNASSISIKLPVSVLANNRELLIESVNDFSQIEEIFNEERFIKDSLSLIYPATAIFADYSEVLLENESQLEAIVAASIEGGDDDDIECYTFNYPLKFSRYDRLNQLAEVQQLNGDQELNELLRRLDENEIGAFNYPITAFNTVAEEITIGNNTELQTLLQNSACDEQDEPYYKDMDIVLPTATLRVLLTDAPFPADLVAEANVTITKLEIRLVDAEEEAFILLSEKEASFNLLDLTNGLTATLVDMQVPLGSYDEIRMLIAESNVLLNDGQVFDLKIPSGSTSGLKIKMTSPLEITEGGAFDVLLDFDVSKSFKVQGNPDTPAGIKGFIFSPTVKAVNLAEAGSIGGTVIDQFSASGIEGVQLSVYAADTLNTTTFTDENGEYTVLGLVTGTYNLTAEHTDYLSKSEENIVITIGNETDVDFELTLE